MKETDADFIWNFHHTIPSTPEKAKKILDVTIENLEDEGWQPRDTFAVRLGLEEALMNAIRHGNKLDAGKMITVAGKLTANTLTVTITDEGLGFDPSAVPDCTDDDRLEVPSGRGLCLMRKFMNEVEYSERGNAVTMRKERSQVPISVAG